MPAQYLAGRRGNGDVHVGDGLVANTPTALGSDGISMLPVSRDRSLSGPGQPGTRRMGRVFKYSMLTLCRSSNWQHSTVHSRAASETPLHTQPVDFRQRPKQGRCPECWPWRYGPHKNCWACHRADLHSVSMLGLTDCKAVKTSNWRLAFNPERQQRNQSC